VTSSPPPGTPSAKTVLIVDDEKNIRRTLQLVLEGEGYQVLGAETAEQGLALLANPDIPVDLAILDVKLPDMSGLEALEKIRKDDAVKDTPIIVISGHATVNDAVQAIKLGASDFFEKPLNRERVLVSVKNVLDAEKTRRALAEVSRHELQKYEMIGRAASMRKLFHEIEKVAPTKAGVLITGESGTGKELISRAIHRLSPRDDGPFIKVNCAAIPRELIESELFGHERGAFTGAVSTRKGVFEQAHGGTLLIDEIGDLELSLQPKLLRAIERSEVRRVGGDKSIKVDVRVLAATRRDLDHEVQAGRFRDDLFHRLAVARIELPPLRRRTGDVPVLARLFWRSLGGDEEALSGDLLLRWQDYGWPGNVRELRNTVARRLALGELGERGPSPDPPEGTSETPGPVGSTHDDFLETILGLDLSLVEARQRMVEEFERRYIDRVLEQHDGSVTKAATASGIAKRYFQRLKSRARK
jgi:DNA-binding NtrC family response regulator